MIGRHVCRRKCLALVFLKPLFVVVNAHQNKARFLVLRDGDRFLAGRIKNIVKCLKEKIAWGNSFRLK